MSMKKVLEKIEQYDKICIYGHTRPDGDCYGSQFGLKEIISNSYPQKEVYVLTENVDYLSFLGISDKVSDQITRDALSIVVDTGVANRISDQRYINGVEIIKIDHHVPIDDYGNIRWVQQLAPACSQMITSFYKRFKSKLKLSAAGATALYTGIYTDSGGFRYRSVSKDTFKAAAVLLENGADLDYVASQLGKQKINEVQFRGYVTGQLVQKGHFSYIFVDRETILKYNVSDETAANCVSSIANIDGCLMWALIMEPEIKEKQTLDENNNVIYVKTQPYRGRVRSVSKLRIDYFVNQFGGGGHETACGINFNSLDEVNKFLEACPKFIYDFLKKCEQDV